MAASRLRAVGTAGVVGVLLLTLGGCGAKSDWTEQQLETEGAKLIKQDFGVDTTIDCPTGLENKQGPSVMCTAPDGELWLFWANNKGELKVRKGQG